MTESSEGRIAIPLVNIDPRSITDLPPDDKIGIQLHRIGNIIAGLALQLKRDYRRPVEARGFAVRNRIAQPADREILMTFPSQVREPAWYAVNHNQDSSISLWWSFYLANLSLQEYREITDVDLNVPKITKQVFMSVAAESLGLMEIKEGRNPWGVPIFIRDSHFTPMVYRTEVIAGSTFTNGLSRLVIAAGPQMKLRTRLDQEEDDQEFVRRFLNVHFYLTRFPGFVYPDLRGQHGLSLDRSRAIIDGYNEESMELLATVNPRTLPRQENGRYVLSFPESTVMKNLSYYLALAGRATMQGTMGDFVMVYPGRQQRPEITPEAAQAAFLDKPNLARDFFSWVRSAMFYSIRDAMEIVEELTAWQFSPVLSLMSKSERRAIIEALPSRDEQKRRLLIPTKKGEPPYSPFDDLNALLKDYGFDLRLLNPREPIGRNPIGWEILALLFPTIPMNS